MGREYSPEKQDFDKWFGGEVHEEDQLQWTVSACDGGLDEKVKGYGDSVIIMQIKYVIEQDFICKNLNINVIRII